MKLYIANQSSRDRDRAHCACCARMCSCAQRWYKKEPFLLLEFTYLVQLIEIMSSKVLEKVAHNVGISPKFIPKDVVVKAVVSLYSQLAIFWTVPFPDTLGQIIASHTTMSCSYIYHRSKYNQIVGHLIVRLLVRSLQDSGKDSFCIHMCKTPNQRPNKS